MSSYILKIIFVFLLEYSIFCQNPDLIPQEEDCTLTHNPPVNVIYPSFNIIPFNYLIIFFSFILLK